MGLLLGRPVGATIITTRFRHPALYQAAWRCIKNNAAEQANYPALEAHPYGLIVFGEWLGTAE
jgi:hypothetical protein